MIINFLICFTETWLNEFESAVISHITGDQYSFLHSSRYLDNMGGIGGGVLFKTFYKYSNFKRINLDYREGLSIDFYLHNSIKFSLFLIYRPPRFSMDDINIFLNEFSDIIKVLRVMIISLLVIWISIMILMFIHIVYSLIWFVLFHLFNT